MQNRYVNRQMSTNSESSIAKQGRVARVGAGLLISVPALTFLFPALLYLFGPPPDGACASKGPMQMDQEKRVWLCKRLKQCILVYPFGQTHLYEYDPCALKWSPNTHCDWSAVPLHKLCDSRIQSSNALGLYGGYCCLDDRDAEGRGYHVPVPLSSLDSRRSRMHVVGRLLLPSPESRQYLKTCP